MAASYQSTLDPTKINSAPLSAASNFFQAAMQSRTAGLNNINETINTLAKLGAAARQKQRETELAMGQNAAFAQGLGILYGDKAQEAIPTPGVSFSNQQPAPIPAKPPTIITSSEEKGLVPGKDTSFQSEARPNQTAMDLIKDFEGVKLNQYYDGGGMPTIGYGSTRDLNGKPIQKGSKISQDQAEQLFNRDYQEALNVVKNNVKVPLNPNQEAALTSFAFNAGPGGFVKSGVLRELNAGNTKKAMSILGEWTRDNSKQVVPGLVTRRQKEIALFNSPYEDQIAASQAPGAAPTVPTESAIAPPTKLEGGLTALDDTTLPKMQEAGTFVPNKTTPNIIQYLLSPAGRMIDANEQIKLLNMAGITPEGIKALAEAGKAKAENDFYSKTDASGQTNYDKGFTADLTKKQGDAASSVYDAEGKKLTNETNQSRQNMVVATDDKGQALDVFGNGMDGLKLSPKLQTQRKITADMHRGDEVTRRKDEDGYKSLAAYVRNYNDKMRQLAPLIDKDIQMTFTRKLTQDGGVIADVIITGSNDREKLAKIRAITNELSAEAFSAARAVQAANSISNKDVDIFRDVMARGPMDGATFAATLLNGMTKTSATLADASAVLGRNEDYEFAKKIYSQYGRKNYDFDTDVGKYTPSEKAFGQAYRYLGTPQFIQWLDSDSNTVAVPQQASPAPSYMPDNPGQVSGNPKRPRSDYQW